MDLQEKRQSQPFDRGFDLPMVAEHGCSSRDAIAVLQLDIERNILSNQRVDVPKRRFWKPGEVHLG